MAASFAIGLPANDSGPRGAQTGRRGRAGEGFAWRLSLTNGFFL
jgi:hypothetical protein